MKQSRLIVLAVAVAASTATAQQPQTPPPRPAAQSRATDGIVAVVGTHPILWSEVLEVIGQERSRGTQMPNDSAGAIEFARNILTQLIDEEVLLQKAAGDTSITVADADVAQTVDRQVQQIRSQFPTSRNSCASFDQPVSARRTNTGNGCRNRRVAPNSSAAWCRSISRKAR
jgi:hypothetical protein